MNKVIFCRLGMGPDPRVSKVLMEEIIANRTDAKFMPLPGVIVSVFESELTPTQIRQRFFDDPQLSEVPFMVFEAKNFDINFPENFRQSVFGLGEVVNEPQTQVCDLTLNDLLDLVSMNGIDSLTPEQRTRLAELSQ